MSSLQLQILIKEREQPYNIQKGGTYSLESFFGLAVVTLNMMGNRIHKMLSGRTFKE